ncbi:hypothetical protein [Flavobacterium sp.]|uniref:hypothetical protein n=1 Tax=Flavobacterium sp. TaxID=239 RepID=UPI00286ABF3D|nr:hypothetical protein [Flavobacterium sp.]
MFTTTPNSHSYKVISEQDNCYEISDFDFHNQLLTDFVKIESKPNKSNCNEIIQTLLFSSNGIDFDNSITLMKTVTENLFYASCNPYGCGSKSLLILEFFRNKKLIVIKVFNGFYPSQIELQKILKTFQEN